MKTKLLSLLLLFSVIASAQTTLTLGAGTSGSATRGPFQRSDSGSSSVFSRAVLHYSSTELVSIGASATISQVNFDLGSENIITASGDATMVIYMRNSTETDVLPVDTSWSDAINGATLVGTYTFNTSNNFPGVEGFMNFILDTSFNYTGGALEILVDWDCSNLISTDAMQPNLLFSGNGSLNWHWDSTAHQSLIYDISSSSAPSILDSASRRKAERVNTQIIYTTGGTPPTPATSGQVIGEFPIMDGGMEDQVADNTMSSAGSGQSGTPQTIWTVSSTSNSAVRDMTDDETLARTGNFSAAFQIASGSSNLRLQSPSTVAPNQLQTNTEYTVQFFYKASVDPGNDCDPGIYLNNTSGSNTTNKTDASPFVADTWTKASGTVTTGADFNASHWAVARMSGSNETLVRVDDFVVYSGAFDDTPPGAPTNATYDTNGNIGWTAPGSGVDSGGYVVVKYTTAPNADNDPNQNGIYEHGNTITNGIGGLTGTVIYIGTATSFTDTYAPGNFYKVYAVDKAFNYSEEIMVSDALLSIPDFTKSDFVLYPNPSQDRVYIEANNTFVISSVSIYDVLGKQVYYSKNIADDVIDVSNLKSGLYIVNILSNGISVSKRIIKE